MSTSHFPFNSFSHLVPVFLILIPVVTVIHISRDWCESKKVFFFPNNFPIDGVKHIETCFKIKNDDPSKLLSWPSLTSSFEWKTKQKENRNEKLGNLSSLINYQSFILLLVHGVSYLNGRCWFLCNFFFLFLGLLETVVLGLSGNVPLIPPFFKVIGQLAQPCYLTGFRACDSYLITLAAFQFFLFPLICSRLSIITV